MNSPTPAALPSLNGSSSFYIHPSTVHANVPLPLRRPVTLETSADTDAIRSSYFGKKRYLDRLFTAILMTMALPIMAIVSMAVLICDGRPIMFRQVRVGKDGRVFRIFKFRTMRRDAEARTGAVWSSATDTRVTRLGRWLRCSHLDELPQFFNVLCGDMNLIGPRPERPEFVETLAKEVPGYLQRNQVRPGITGLAQLKLGYDESIAGVPRKLACDMDYIRKASLSTDIGLLCRTIPHIVVQLWARLQVRFSLNRQVPDRYPAAQQRTTRSVSNGVSPNLKKPKFPKSDESIAVRRVTMRPTPASIRFPINEDVA
jgi:lipopolysaccharide/colanic/teichoic acid biosynthesis glycosyltransferase